MIPVRPRPPWPTRCPGSMESGELFRFLLQVGPRMSASGATSLAELPTLQAKLTGVLAELARRGYRDKIRTLLAREQLAAE